MIREKGNQNVQKWNGSIISTLFIRAYHKISIPWRSERDKREETGGDGHDGDDGRTAARGLPYPCLYLTRQRTSILIIGFLSTLFFHLLDPSAHLWTSSEEV